MRALRAELLKLASLPATWVGAALTVVLPVALTALTGSQFAHALRTGQLDALVSTSTTDEGFGQLMFGLVGISVLAVVSVSSEYARNSRDVGGSRQITTTMVAVPARAKAMSAKLAALLIWLGTLAVVTFPLTLWVSRLALGEFAPEWGATLLPRMLGALLYWVVMALLAVAVTTLTRSGLVPLVLLIANASMVSVTLLLSGVTPWVKVLPDAAAMATYLTDLPLSPVLTPAAGAAVSVGWMLLFCALAVGTYVRRDA